MKIFKVGIAVIASLLVNQDTNFRFAVYSGASVVQDGAGSRGSSWGDIDGDGDLDLFVANRGNQVNLLYINKTIEPNQPILELTSEGNIVTDQGDSQGSSFGDYDKDGDLDLYVANRRNQQNFFYRNNGNGSFEKIMEGPHVTDTYSSTSVSWVDINNDGYLDLFTANRNDEPNGIYINDKRGSFTKLESGSIVKDIENTRTCVWADFDNDGDQDLFVGNARQNNSLYINQGDLKFTKLTEGEIVGDGGYTYGVSAVDVNNDGFVDLFVSNLNGLNNLYLNEGNMRFSKVKTEPFISDEGDSKGHVWQDFDNDGDLDLFVSNGTPGSIENHFFYSNDGSGNFLKINDVSIVQHGGLAGGSSSADVNGDGQMDLLVTNWVDNSNNKLFFNLTNVEKNMNWVQIDLKGIKSPNPAYGAQVAIHYLANDKSKVFYQSLNSQSGYASQSSPILHFGIGTAKTIDSIVVKWPSGIIQSNENIKINLKQTIEEKIKNS